MQFHRLASLTLAVLFVGLGGSNCTSPDPEDGCTVYYHGNFQGEPLRVAVPNGTWAVDSWANSSERLQVDDLAAAGMQDSISSAKIVAKDSAVSLYLFEHMDFDGNGRVFHCEKGQTCQYESVGWINDLTSSLICQREFINQYDGVSDEAMIVDFEPFEPVIQAMASLELGFEVPYVSIDWITETEYCDYITDHGENPACDEDDTHYTDILQVIMRFSYWRKITAIFYVKPMLDDGVLTYHNSGYWYHITGGIDIITDLIKAEMDARMPAIAAEMPGNFLFLSDWNADPGFLGDRSRLQMHMPNASSGDVDWYLDEMTPIMVLNRTRSY